MVRDIADGIHRKNLVHISISPSHGNGHEFIIRAITKTLKATCGTGFRRKIRLDILVAPHDSLFIDATVRSGVAESYRALQVSGDGLKNLEWLLSNLYLQMVGDERIPAWNKARFVFDIDTGRTCLAYRWDDDYSWFVDGYLDSPGTIDLGRKAGRQILSWEGFPSSQPRPWHLSHAK